MFPTLQCPLTAAAGLISAMYMKGEEAVQNPDPSSGLYIRTRAGEDLRVVIPADHIAFQMGEAMQVPSSFSQCLQILCRMVFHIC